LGRKRRRSVRRTPELESDSELRRPLKALTKGLRRLPFVKRQKRSNM